jgi:hypothetical protein
MRLKICGRSYTVRRGSIPGNFGLCDPCNAVITIADDLEEHTNMSPALIELHEVIHAVLHETGLTCVLTDKTEEAITHGLAIQLHGLGYRR